MVQVKVTIGEAGFAEGMRYRRTADPDLRRWSGLKDLSDLGGIIADVMDRDGIGKMVERLRAGEVRTLARAISLVEDGSATGAELVKACRQYADEALRIGITGSPGVGKSTLVDQMARLLRQDGLMVGVVAVDPSSAYTGGALLGDRIRMQGLSGDEGVYIRSMASRGAKGGVAAAVEDVCVLMAAAGRQVILIETIGVGQDQVEVAELADVTVLLLVPGMGDEMQSLKAGVMEAADIFVVNKSDREGTEQVEAEILAMQRLAANGEGWVSPVVRTVATDGTGIREVMEAVRRCPARKRVEKRQVAFQGERLQLDHLGVAVKSIAAARGFYESLGLAVSHEETVEHEKVKAAMLPLGESRIELLEATDEDSTIGRFVATQGEGVHHVAVRVNDVDEMFERLQRQGVRLASDKVKVGVGGHRYFFVHPASAGGVLVEIVGNLAEEGV